MVCADGLWLSIVSLNDWCPLRSSLVTCRRCERCGNRNGSWMHADLPLDVLLLYPLAVRLSMHQLLLLLLTSSIGNVGVPVGGVACGLFFLRSHAVRNCGTPLTKMQANSRKLLGSSGPLSVCTSLICLQLLQTKPNAISAQRSLLLTDVAQRQQVVPAVWGVDGCFGCRFASMCDVVALKDEQLMELCHVARNV